LPQGMKFRPRIEPSYNLPLPKMATEIKNQPNHA
jgi:hypothetical protein